MKKLFLMLILLFALLACNKTDELEEIDELKDVTFEDASFEYDGKVHYIEVINLPATFNVEYENNYQRAVGSYEVEAIISTSDGVEVKTLKAILTITEQGEEVDLSNIIFTDDEFEYTGYPLSLKALNVPSGITVEYENNDQTEPGEYVVIAKFINSNNIVIKTLSATLTITKAEENTEIPTIGDYALVINEKYYYVLEKNPTPLDTSFDEYFIKNVEISIDDKVKFYNISTEISWVIKLVDSASGGSWVVDENEGIICQETGSYDLYLKMKYQADQVYFELKGSSQPDTLGYEVKIGAKSYQLELNSNNNNKNFVEYYISGVSVVANEEVLVYNGTKLITNIGDERSGSTDNGNNILGNGTNGMKVVATSGSCDIYLKVYTDGGYSIYMTK